MKLMNILDNSVLCHTIEKDFTNIENKEEQAYLYFSISLFYIF